MCENFIHRAEAEADETRERLLAREGERRHGWFTSTEKLLTARKHEIDDAVATVHGPRLDRARTLLNLANHDELTDLRISANDLAFLEGA
jgi:hypothetical protein